MSNSCTTRRSSTCGPTNRWPPASVVKAQVTLEAETWFAEGRLDPRERVTLSAADQTPGPAGISLLKGVHLKSLIPLNGSGGDRRRPSA